MTWVETFTGVAVDLLHPRLEDIKLEDIAHSLAHQCRYNGHCREHYSVAQHSVHVSFFLKGRGYSPNVQLAGLMHDAQEAYLGDLVQPMKRIKDIGEAYAKLEKLWEALIEDRFRIKMDSRVRQDVRIADMVLLATEARDLMVTGGVDWNLLEPAMEDMTIVPWTAVTAKKVFLDRFEKLQQDCFPPINPVAA